MIPFTVFLANFSAFSVQLDFLVPDPLSFLFGSGEQEDDRPFALTPFGLSLKGDRVLFVASDERRRGD